MTTATVANAHDVDLDVPGGSLSYTLGVQFAIQISDQLRSVGVPLSGEVMAQAIADVLTASELKLTEEQMQAAMQEFTDNQTKMQQEMIEMVKSSGDQFRAEFAKQEGVKSTDSGLLYMVIEEGTGDKPGPDSTVTVHYRGTLTDGSEFDSSYSRDEPTTFSLGGIIPGWVEALQLMSVGAKYQIVLPPELGYGEQGSPPVIPPSATLVFDIELLSIE
ncbi:MAG: FKBP-type peptidyl-prolyl cis-trans isomerase [Acidiferrobacterales bacterium]|nr:FKBP-type peptidyl-prolyl cis-trans isomerase [Acidiferrobacterales bacterium]